MGNRPNRTRRDNVRIENPVIVEQDLVDEQDILNQVLEASKKESPLPLGWEEATNERGESYYIDHNKHTTTFLDPRLPASARCNKKKKKGKLPKYKRTLYAKVQSFLVKLHNNQQDDGQLDIVVSRTSLLEDSFNLISCLDSLTLTRRLFIKFHGEEGLDYGGMSREWFLSLSEEILNPELHLFVRSSNGYRFQINRHSHKNQKHLDYFRFFGVILGMAIYHAKIFNSYFTIPFYKSILGLPGDLSDLKHDEPDMYQCLVKLKEGKNVSEWDLYFTVPDKNEKGEVVQIELKEGGSDILVTDDNKNEFITLVQNYYLKSTEKQYDHIKEGLHMFVPRDLLVEFEPEEIEMILGGLSEFDIEDLRSNTVYSDGFTESTNSVKLFWEVLSTLSQSDLEHFLQFTTGSSKVPVGGFAHLYGSNGAQKFTIIPKKTEGLPTAHACFNRLELPQYTDKDKLKKDLMYAIKETHGFGLE
eukprot:TRINITY_DN12211_c0_g1_i1.p1 TRINITY_DN12211_c0_g1~~TRINITY_DN12211_c0_g1_i1.p1  ORF type:complete len:473 (+),score=88.07 TRINITY_DN12211_c0_g1_i1:162-1580(+)